jgi:hypothetical protein
VGDGERQDAGHADGDGDDAGDADRIAEEHQAKHRHLDDLGLGIGGADREVAEGKEGDQEKSEDDLAEAAEEAVD